MTRRVPPGRSGRLFLRARLATSERAGELLHQKEEALRREQTQLRAEVTRSLARWQRACGELERVIAQVRVLGGADELAVLLADLDGPRAAPERLATVTPQWRTQMGVAYPGEIRIVAGDPPLVVSTAAFAAAIGAARNTLAVAADHAAATCALERVDREVAQTRHRRRAVTKRLVPRLRDELHQIEIRLDESEREEAIMIRLAVDRGSGPT